MIHLCPQKSLDGQQTEIEFSKTRNKNRRCLFSQDNSFLIFYPAFEFVAGSTGWHAEMCRRFRIHTFSVLQSGNKTNKQKQTAEVIAHEKVEF